MDHPDIYEVMGMVNLDDRSQAGWFQTRDQTRQDVVKCTVLSLPGVMGGPLSSEEGNSFKLI